MPSSAPTALDPRLPVIVGVGQLAVRTDAGEDPVEPAAMAAEAARRAAADAGVPDPGALLAGIDTVGIVPVLSWPYPDPAALVAAEIGAEPRRRWGAAIGGNGPQSMLSRAARAIADGEADLVLVGGAEAWRSRSRGGDPERPWTTQPAGSAPTEVLGDLRPMSHPDELALGLVLPVVLYALFESAVRAAAGRSPAEHQRHLAELWAGFSEVAATNPHAWIRTPRSAEEIGSVSPANRMISVPYPKLMTSNNQVDQGAAVLMCSVERARALGVPTDRWVFPWSSTDASDTWFVSHRVSFHRSPAIGIAGRTALRLAGLDVDDLAHLDVYSCFPSAVQVAATELGVGLDRPLTVTGGLTFAGGPWNDYVTHSVAAMVDRLRADPGARGLVTANGGYLTKHAFGVYSTDPPPSGRHQHRDVQAEVDDVGAVELASDHVGAVRIEAATVLHDGGGDPLRAYLAVRTPERHRAWAISEDPDVMALVAHDEPVGVAAHRAADATLHL